MFLSVSLAERLQIWGVYETYFVRRSVINANIMGEMKHSLSVCWSCVDSNIGGEKKFVRLSYFIPNLRGEKKFVRLF